jgi:hypothetical protein
MANMIVGDFVLVYRCYIVYGRRWLVIIPSLILFLSGIAIAIQFVQVQITISNSAVTLNSNILKPWWSAFFAITAAQNVLTTCKLSILSVSITHSDPLALLVWRIWRVERQIEKYYTGSFAPTGQPRLRKVIRVVAESGAAYSTLVFMTFVVGMCNSNAIYPLADAVSTHY